MKNSPIIPTVFSYNKKEFEDKFKKVIKVSDKIQIDIMDGKITPKKSVSIKDVQNLKKFKREFEAHLMVKNPKKYFEICKKKGFQRVIFHVESCKDEVDLNSTIKNAKKLKLEVYVAINPNTKLKRIKKILEENLCQGVLLLGVIPGKEGQKLFSKIPRRIRRLKKANSKIIIQVDGGVNEKTCFKLSKAGADFLNSGSFISKSSHPLKNLKILQKQFRLAKN